VDGSFVLDRSTGQVETGPGAATDLSNAVAGGTLAVLASAGPIVATDTNGVDDVYAALVVPDGRHPRVSTEDASVVEGGSATVHVSLSRPTTNIVTVDWTTVSGTAVGGLDFAGASGQLVFWPGETAKTITVDTYDDALHESTERFSVVLTGAHAADIGESTAVVRILDNDPR
jgi:Calx-beta domain